MPTRLGAFALLLLIVLPPVALAARDARLVSVHLNDDKVRAVTSSGQVIAVTKRGRCDDPELSPDSATVGFLVLSRLRSQPGDPNAHLEVAKELRIWRNGRILRRIVPGGFIRSWGFWDRGGQVAVYSGGLHFAGFYVLYDVSTGRELERATDPVSERSPDWVRSLSD